MPEKWRSPHRKRALTAFLTLSGSLCAVLGRREEFSTRDFGDSTLDALEGFAPPLWPAWPVPRLNKSQ